MRKVVEKFGGGGGAGGEIKEVETTKKEKLSSKPKSHREAFIEK